MVRDKIIENDCKEEFSKYVNSLFISKSIKKTLTDEELINNNPLYYLYYPRLFSTCFQVSADNLLKELSIAGYLYYLSVLFLDDVIDDDKKENIALATICQEEAIKLLTSIFGLNSSYWLEWNKRRDEYFKAIHIEKSLFNKKKVSLEEYTKLADYKATFGKAAIDAVFVLSGGKDEKIYQLLLKSHAYFSVAFQLNDDIQDFKKDIENQQFNWAVYYMFQKEDINELSPKNLNKLFYIKDYSKNILYKAIEYIEKALEMVKEIDVPLWKSTLKTIKKQFLNSILETENYIEVLKAEISHSTELSSSQDIHNSICAAIEFIKSNQKEDGSWRDYVNQGGISNIWSTAYILTKVSSEPLRGMFKKEIERGVSFLEDNSINNGWGYNSTWIKDADSTTFAMLAFNQNKVPIANKIFDEWYEFQNSDGSFSTYKNSKYLLESLYDKKISNVKGWTSKHLCVSSAAFYLLAKSKANSNNFNKLKTLFDNLLSTNFNSYWWTSPIYTMYYLSYSYAAIGEYNKVTLLLDRVKNFQNPNGSFSDKYNSSYFYSGLALDILLLDKKSCKKEIEMVVDYLLNSQFKDGSWENSNCLQIPNANDIAPDEMMFPVSTYGTNVRAKEFNRLFTTSTILSAIANYEQARTNTKVG